MKVNKAMFLQNLNYIVGVYVSCVGIIELAVREVRLAETGDAH